MSAIAGSWEHLRSGATTFGQVARTAGTAAPSAEALAAAAGQPARRRLVRAGAVGGSGAPSGGSGEGATIIDLLDSPSPAALARARRQAAAAAADERLAWRALDAAVADERPRGRRRSGGGGRAAEEEAEDELELPLSGGLRMLPVHLGLIGKHASLPARVSL